jgi:hypothetical protein
MMWLDIFQAATELRIEIMGVFFKCAEGGALRSSWSESSDWGLESAASWEI